MRRRRRAGGARFDTATHLPSGSPEGSPGSRGWRGAECSSPHRHHASHRASWSRNTEHNRAREHGRHALHDGGIGRQRRDSMRHHLPRLGPDPVKVRPAGPLPKRTCSKQKCGWRNAGRGRNLRPGGGDHLLGLCLREPRLCPRIPRTDMPVCLHRRVVRHERPRSGTAFFGAQGAEAPRGGQCGGRAGASLARPDEKPLPGLPRPNVLIPPVYPPQHHREAVGSPRNTLYFLVAADRHCDNEQREHARLFVAGKLNVYIAAAASIYGT